MAESNPPAGASQLRSHFNIISPPYAFSYLHTMFSAFKLSRPQISIFHSPSSPASVQALKLLNAAISGPYPPSKPSAPPLSFNLEVVENQPPTADQLRTILSYLPGVSSLDGFMSAHYAVDAKPSDPAQLTKIASKEPRALKWPIVVNWEGGKAAVGDLDGVKQILEDLRKKRDGETKGDE